MEFMGILLVVLFGVGSQADSLSTIGPFTYAFKHQTPLVYSTAPNTYHYVNSIIPMFRSTPQFVNTAQFRTIPQIVNTAPFVRTVAAPIAAPAPVVQTVAVESTPTFSQFHSQDESGAYSFGYSGGPSSRHEVKTADGTVTGSFNYIDPTGLVQSQNYVSDKLGFRVAATNLPVSPAAPVVVVPVAPVPVKDTPEVEKARSEFFAKFEESKKRTKRSPQQFTAFYPEPKVSSANVFGAPISSVVPTFHSANVIPTQYATQAVPIAYSAANVVPTTYAAADLRYRPGNLMSVVNNPGHAVSYRVY